MRLPMRFAIAILALGALLLSSMFAVLRVGPWLVVSDPLPPRLDVIFTFAGENPRLHYSRDLMGRYPEAHWVLSDYHHFYSRILVRNGFNMARVTAVDSASNTLSEVKALSAWLRTQGIPDSTAARNSDTAVIAIGLVSSPYHMRRIRFMVRDLFPERNGMIRFHYLPVPFEKYSWKREDLRTWWRSKTLRAHVTSEIGKMLLYRLFD